MNILVLTPIHPIQIVEMSELMRKFGQYNNVYSIQHMALMAEQIGKNYIAANQTFTYEIMKKPKLIKTIGRRIENTIVYGNLDKRTNIKFDHILGFTDHIAEDENDWDKYLTEANALMMQVYEDTRNPHALPPQYYTKEDAHHIFPTVDHLMLFLRTLNLKENDTEDAV